MDRSSPLLLRRLYYQICRLSITQALGRVIYRFLIWCFRKYMQFNFPELTAYQTHPFSTHTVYGLSDVDLAIVYPVKMAPRLPDCILAVTRFTRKLLIFDSGSIVYIPYPHFEALPEGAVYCSHVFPIKNWRLLAGEERRRNSLPPAAFTLSLQHAMLITRKIPKLLSLWEESRREDLILLRHIHRSYFKAIGKDTHPHSFAKTNIEIEVNSRQVMITRKEVKGSEKIQEKVMRWGTVLEKAVLYQCPDLQPEGDGLKFRLLLVHKKGVPNAELISLWNDLGKLTNVYLSGPQAEISLTSSCLWDNQSLRRFSENASSLLPDPCSLSLPVAVNENETLWYFATQHLPKWSAFGLSERESTKQAARLLRLERHEFWKHELVNVLQSRSPGSASQGMALLSALLNEIPNT